MEKLENLSLISSFFGTGSRNERSTYVIFEAGLNHNGSHEMACELVRAAANSGADAVKFQKRDIESLATRQILNSEETRFPSLGKTYREVRTKLELSFDSYKSLKNLSHELGIDFLVTPFDLTSLNFLLDLGVDGLKVASHSVANPRLLKAVAATKLPVIMSSGMVTLPELDSAVEVFSEKKEFALLHCTSDYPTPDEGANLALIPVLKERYALPIGISSHELGTLHTLTAVALGATLVERHVTLDKTLEGFDHKISLEVEEFSNLVKEIRRIETLWGSGEKSVTPAEQITRDKYRVSMVSSFAIRKGSVLHEDMVTFKNPGTGISAIESETFFGRILARDVEQDELLFPSDFEA